MKIIKIIFFRLNNYHESNIIIFSIATVKHRIHQIQNPHQENLINLRIAIM